MKSGQVCLSPEYLLIDKNVNNEFNEIWKNVNELIRENGQAERD